MLAATANAPGAPAGNSARFRPMPPIAFPAEPTTSAPSPSAVRIAAHTVGASRQLSTAGSKLSDRLITSAPVLAAHSIPAATSSRLPTPSRSRTRTGISEAP